MAPAPAKAKDAPTDKKADPKEKDKDKQKDDKKDGAKDNTKKKGMVCTVIEFICKGKLAEARNVLITAIFIVFWVFLLAHSLF
jgi:hypothetical protein